MCRRANFARQDQASFLQYTEQMLEGFFKKQTEHTEKHEEVVRNLGREIWQLVEKNDALKV